MAEGADRSLRLYVWSWAVLLVGLAAAAASAVAFPPPLDVRLLLMVAGTAFSELYRLALPKYALSLSYPLSMAAAMLGGPASACLVAAVAAVGVEDIREGVPLPVMVFNQGMLLLSAAVGGVAYVLAGGRVLAGQYGYVPLGASDFPGALLGMIAAALGSYGVNLILTSTGVNLYRGVPFRTIAKDVLQIAPSQVALVFVGFLMAQVLAISAIALPLFILPLVVAREYYQRYTALRDSYAGTIEVLVGALEAKDSYTRGHSVRVAAIARDIGEALGLPDAELESLEYAALLHDLGKLSLSSEVLVKPAALTDSEMSAMRDHPRAGADMVARIPPLRGLTEHIGAHHEWYNGEGYPARVAGSDIPKYARILAVADAYDAMTTNRSYRRALDEDEAMEEIRNGSGTQFDPEVVEVFIQARLKAPTDSALGGGSST